MALFCQVFALRSVLRKYSKTFPWKWLVPDLSDLDDDTADVVAEVGRRIAGDDVEFLNGVGAGDIGNVVVVGLVDVHAVEREVVVLLACAVDVGTAGAEGGLRGLEGEDVGADRRPVPARSAG